MSCNEPSSANVSELLSRLLSEPEGARLTLEEWTALLPGGTGRDGFTGDAGLTPREDGRLNADGTLRFEDTSRPLAVGDEDLRRMADARRRAYHPDDVVTYVVDRNVNYSNVCTSICNFCAFYRSPGDAEGYVHDYETIFRKVEETLELGGSGVLMQGGLHPDLPLEWYTGLLSGLKERYPVHLHCFSPTEIHGLHEVLGLTYRQILEALIEAGLDSMPGGGGEILVDEVRRKRRSKVDTPGVARRHGGRA